MPEEKGKHLSKENREVIEAGIRNADSARKIAKRINVAASTVTREVKANRTTREKKAARGAKLSVRCGRYRDCQASGTACTKCSTRLTTCKNCKTRNCIDSCPDYERTTCPATESWPYVCPERCAKRPRCSYPKRAYDAGDADAAYRERLKSAREGIDIDVEGLAAMNDLIVPLVKRGQSFEAIWATHSGELPVCVRCAYNYQEKGVLATANIDLPRKVRIKARRKGKDGPARTRIDRTGRTYEDFCALSLSEQVRTVQGDSVVGYEDNACDILSLHIVACGFQIYLHKEHGKSTGVVGWFDAMEGVLGSPEAFDAVFGILLCDRGVEFDDWEGMERSCLDEGKRRCRVFYCDALQSNQKSQAERNHEQLRRILPKGRSDFDKLSVYDTAVCASHVNSYPLASRGGKCPFDLAGSLLEQGLLDELGIARVAPDDVMLKPYLMKHAVIQ